MLITAERNCAISLALLQKLPFASFLVLTALARLRFIARRVCSPPLAVLLDVVHQIDRDLQIRNGSTSPHAARCNPLVGSKQVRGGVLHVVAHLRLSQGDNVAPEASGVPNKFISDDQAIIEVPVVTEKELETT